MKKFGPNESIGLIILLILGIGFFLFESCCIQHVPNYPPKEDALYHYQVWGIGYTDTLHCNTPWEELELTSGGCLWDPNVNGYRYCNLFKFEQINTEDNE